MAVVGYLKLSPELGLFKHYGKIKQFKSMDLKSRANMLTFPLSSHALRQDAWSLHVADGIYKPPCHVLYSCHVFTCQSLAMPSSIREISLLKSTTLALTRLSIALHGSPLVFQLISTVGTVAFALWGLGPLMRCSRKLFLRQNDDSNWKKSTAAHYVFTSYLQPLLLWTGCWIL